MNPRPQPGHELLLRAILLEGEKSLQAWRRWQETVGLSNIDHAAQRLIPMIYQKCRNNGLTAAEAQICKGVYLHTWYNNNNFLHQVKPLIEALRSRGIKVAPIKGLALTLLYLRDPGLRPMSDFDILVPAARKPEAIGILESLGWKKGFLAPHGQAFSNGNFECDLHWHLLQEHCRADSDHDYWSAATPASVQDMDLYQLHPADLLLHICVHGAWWNPTPPIRWVVDAMVIIDREKSLDWTRLVEQSRKRRMVLPILRAMTYLKNEFSAGIPDLVFDSLMRERVTYRDKVRFRIKTTPAGERSVFGAFCFCWVEYKQMAASKESLPNPVGFLKFLKQRWHIRSLWRLPFRAGREVWRRT
jgi:hypothetical protein